MFKFLRVDFVILISLFLIFLYGGCIIWSATGKDVNLITHRCVHILLSFFLMLIISYVSPRFYYDYAFYLYASCLFLLLLVYFFGDYSKGAQRWLGLGIIRFQPSEIIKIVLPLVLSKFISKDIYFSSFYNKLLFLFLVFIPIILTWMQPDLGTSILVFLSGFFFVFF